MLVRLTVAVKSGFGQGLSPQKLVACSPAVFPNGRDCFNMSRFALDSILGKRCPVLSLNTIHHLDCLPGLRDLDKDSVDLAFADPPFNIGYDYDVYEDQREHVDYLAWCREWIGGVVRALRPTGTFWLAIGDEYAAELKVMMQQEFQLTCRSWVVWYYTFGVNCKNKFSRSHAHLFHMVQGPEAVHVQRRRDPRPFGTAAGLRRPAGQSARALAGRHVDSSAAGPADGIPTRRGYVVFSARGRHVQGAAGWHGCQMPEQLLGRIIRACSNPDELVLDPFAGSGTTLAVAKKLGRRFIGFELSASYAESIQQRLAQIRPGDPLDGAPEPLVSAPNTASGRRLDADSGTQGPRSRKKTARERRLPGIEE